MKKWLLLGIFPLVLIYFFVYQAKSLISVGSNLGVLDYSLPARTLETPPEVELLQGEKISGVFTAHADNLGLVAIRFYNFNRINADSVIFRIKEVTTAEPYYQHQYTTDQFLPNNLFTFGFPPIPDSAGKEYYFEVESVQGVPGDAVALSSTMPQVLVRHTFDKSELQQDPGKLVHFVLKKLSNAETFHLDNQLYIRFLRTVLILTIYFGMVFYHTRKLKRNSVKKLWRQLKKRLTFNKSRRKKILVQLDEFFLLTHNRGFPQLDGVRGWAVLMVVMAHTTAPLGDILNAETASTVAKSIFTFLTYLPFIGTKGGGAGVDLFFMLSAFLIFMTLHKREQTIGSFLKKRLQRLLPAHIAVLLPLVVGLPLLTIILNIFFLSELFPKIETANVLTWTMTYELAFYAVAGWWYILHKHTPKLQSWRFFFIFTAVIYTSQIVSPMLLVVFNIKYFEMSRFMAFFFGLGLAKLYFTDPLLWKKLEKYFVYATIPGLLLVHLFRYSWTALVFYQSAGEVGTLLSFLVLDLGYFLFLASLLTQKNKVWKRIFSNRWLRIVGVVSYSLYLNHLVLGLPLARRLSSTVPTTSLQMIGYVLLANLLSFVIAVFMFHYLEKPYFLRKQKPTRN